jgi:anion-transporting  ArsA/GET3 family ATPase
MEFSTQKLIFVTGKGGVGKSVAAASIAWAEARKGKRVCLVELGGQSFYETFFETRGITYEPSEVVPDLHIAILNPEDCLKEYVLHYLKVPQLYDIFFQNRVMKAFLNAAPALAEISILGRLTGEIRGILKQEYDLYVVDCFSTGHAMALLRAPSGLRSVFRSGPMYEQATDIERVLKDPSMTHYVLVTLPEEMPVTETMELHAHLKREMNVDATVICNKMITPPLTASEREELHKTVKDEGMHEFLEFLRFKEDVQGKELHALGKFSPKGYVVPLILNAVSGQDYIEEFAKCLEQPRDL